MTNEEVRQYAYDHAEEVLTKARVNGYICPFCSSGSGSKGTGMTENPRNPKHYTCWSCGFMGDIIDLIGYQYNANTYPEKLEAVRREFGLPEASPSDRVKIAAKVKPTPKDPTPEQIAAQEAAAQKRAETINRFIVLASNKLNKDHYHKSRGISDATAKRFHLGYDYVGYYGLALIIPTGDRLSNYTARYVLDTPARYAKPAGVAMELFNPAALYNTTDKPIFITEGELDALSIEEVGGAAVGLGSTQNAKLLLSSLKGLKPSSLLVLALDNDDAGKAAAEKLAADLKALSVDFVIYNPYGSCKDANEALLKGDLKENINIFAGITTAAGATRAIKQYRHRRTSAFYEIPNFINGIKASVNTPVISTGFPFLDDRLDGGLYEGLYVLGAVSSLGKTTFALQMADQIAAQDIDVLIFSLEMSRTELMAKSISRHTCKICLQEKHDLSNAKTVRGVTDGRRWQYYNETEREILQNSVLAYKKYAQNIFIIEGQGEMGVEQIRKEVATHIEMSQGRQTVVIVDYLQILAPSNQYTGDKQNTDKAILELKRISRDYKLPILAISSFNRESYDKPVTMAAFKESGSIEYGCDILFGLQLAGVGKSDFNADQEYKKNPRSIELKILKNRNGEKGIVVQYRYFPMFNLYREQNPIQNK